MTRFGIFLPADPESHIESLRAVVQGMNAQDLQSDIFPLLEGYRPCDVMVTFGVAKQATPRGRAIEQLMAAHQSRLAGVISEKPNESIKEHFAGSHLVVERGFLLRDRYYMLGWGGLNGRANYYNANSPADRWRKLKIRVEPWRTNGSHIVLCGQVPWDASVQHSDHAVWCRETALQIKALTDRPIVFRPHPMQPAAIDMTGLPVRISHAALLAEDMQNAWAVVTFSSNAGVEATLAGIPAFVVDPGAMGYSLLNRDLAQIESPAMPDRQQWLYDLAYTQWNIQEIAEGRAIRHLWCRRQPLLSRLKKSWAKIRNITISDQRRAA